MKRKLLFFFLLPCLSLAWSQPRFEAQVVDLDIAIGYGLAIGDVDGDKLPDILLADKKEFVWYRNPDWQRYVLAKDLTERDNVCLAARDLDGDGKVEIAVGGQWNPGETHDPEASGSVHYLIRPDDPTQLWEAVALPHVPTIHRMKWTLMGDQPLLLVLPLHGVGNEQGEGETVRLLAYPLPDEADERWTLQQFDTHLHMTHNFVLGEQSEDDMSMTDMLIAGKEGIHNLLMVIEPNTPSPHLAPIRGEDLYGPLVAGQGFGEVAVGFGPKSTPFVAGIHPMHGNQLKVFSPGNTGMKEQVLCEDMRQGHALAVGDILGLGHDQIVVGWRQANAEGKVGIRLYVPDQQGNWQAHVVDDNTMACEDLKLADLNGDGKLDIIAAGRDSHNVKVYWNRN